LTKKRFIVPIITSYYEYEAVEAESPEDAVQRCKDGEGEALEYMTEWRGVVDVLDDQVVEAEIE
jgi:hypothetical protein